MMSRDETIEGVLTEAVITEGRIEISAEGKADLSLHTPDLERLSTNEIALSLRVVGDDYRTTVDLDGGDVRMLGLVLDRLRDEDVVDLATVTGNAEPTEGSK